MTIDLLSRHCAPLPKGTPPLKGKAADPYLAAVSGRWKVVDDHHLEGEFAFEDFLGALAFTNRAGGAAETEGHHPDITLTWGKATVRIWTHSIGGLSENDFILAARLDTLA
ncbi:MAG: 4a-hydroxytetrahydrobiopterin dehydratase [Gemmatimonadetes bacterium]|nr:4a-hydroxytetrahydrobiopterin dehydratase [Gemmatimonadota bacterium]